LFAAAIAASGIIFTLIFYTETLPAIADSTDSRKTGFPMRLFQSHNSHKHSLSNVSVSAMSTVSDTDTLVDPDSPSSPSTERLLSKMPQGVDDNGFGVRKRGWTFRELMRHRPVQILSVTMFLNA
jgi:hypothetical protein